jgi:hypothetical protein
MVEMASCRKSAAKTGSGCQPARDLEFGVKKAKSEISLHNGFDLTVEYTTSKQSGSVCV